MENRPASINQRLSPAVRQCIDDAKLGFMERLKRPEELVGVVAIVLGIVGALFQMAKVHKTLDTTSFSPVYLWVVVLAESLFCLQGAIKKSPTIMMTRLAAAAYFTYILVVYLRHKDDVPEPKKKKNTE